MIDVNANGFGWGTDDSQIDTKPGYVLYQLNGNHPLYGRDVLLYIGCGPMTRYQNVTIDRSGFVIIPESFIGEICKSLPCDMYIGFSYYEKYLFAIPCQYFHSIKDPFLLASPLLEAGHDLEWNKNCPLVPPEMSEINFPKTYNRFVKEKVRCSVDAAGKLKLPDKMTNVVGLTDDIICWERIHHVEFLNKWRWEKNRKQFWVEFDRFEHECSEKGLM